MLFIYFRYCRGNSLCIYLLRFHRRYLTQLNIHILLSLGRTLERHRLTPIFFNKQSLSIFF